jgi:acetyl-CoA C-acetyltransferase
MGTCAETCVTKYEFSREEQDDYSHESYRPRTGGDQDGQVQEEIAIVEIEGTQGQNGRRR